MKVKELIVLLQRVKNQDATVLVMGDGDPLYCDIDSAFLELPVDGSVVIQPRG